MHRSRQASKREIWMRRLWSIEALDWLSTFLLLKVGPNRIQIFCWEGRDSNRLRHRMENLHFIGKGLPFLGFHHMYE